MQATDFLLIHPGNFITLLKIFLSLLINPPDSINISYSYLQVFNSGNNHKVDINLISED